MPQQNRVCGRGNKFFTGLSRSSRFAVMLLCFGAIFAAGAGAVTGCGKKADPLVPHAIGPQSVKRFRAVARSGGIILLWRAPTLNTDETPLLDLESFKIYREEVRFEDRCQKCPKNFKLLFEYPYKGQRGTVPGRELFYYTDRSVQPGNVYSYKITCLNGRNMRGEDSDTVTVFWDVPPAAPKELKIERSGRSVILEWRSPETLENGNPLDEQVGFEIYRSTQQGVFENPPLNPEPVAETTYTDRPDSFDQTYYYTVRAVRRVFDTVIESAPAAEVSLLFDDITPPGAPQGLTAIPLQEGVMLKWMAKAEQGVAGFIVYRKDAAAKTFVRISRDIIAENSWLDKTARRGQFYTYVVTAVDQSLRKNESTYSQSVTVTFLPP